MQTGTCRRATQVGCPPARGEGWDWRPAGRSPASRRDLVCRLRALAEGNLEGLRGAVSLSSDRHHVSRLVLEEEIEERALGRDLLTVEGGDHVTRLDSSVRRRSILDDFGDALTVGGCLALDAKIWPTDLAIGEQIGGGAADGIAFDRECHVGRSGVRAAQHAGADASGVDTDNLTAQVEQRATRVAVPD